jgi:1-deoxy-D-xylulose-5-phosphate synthase
LSILESYQGPNDLKKLSIKELELLASEIRDFLIKNVLDTGGHLSSNLGVIEATIALHYVFDIKDDKLFFDVSHQSYTHKILTGRKDMFSSLRKTNGLNGFTDHRESEYDYFESGHSGTSISAMVGYLLANRDNTNNAISFIGDASIVNGCAMEGLNLLGANSSIKGIIILNDNFMSISKVVGSFSRNIQVLKSKKTYSSFKGVINKVFPKFLVNFLRRIKRSVEGLFYSSNIYKDLGFDYLGPTDGHNIKQLIKLYKIAKKSKKSIVVHIITEKGRGLDKDKNFDEVYHSYSPNSSEKMTFGETLFEEIIAIRKNRELFVISPAMGYGAGIYKFSELFKDSFIDCGIAEEHALGLADEMSRYHLVILSLYSSFSQRAFDLFINEINRKKRKIIVLIDRASLNAKDGQTHHGIYDLLIFSRLENIEVSCPSSIESAKELLYYGINSSKSLIIRYESQYVTNNSDEINTIDNSWIPMNDINLSNNFILSFGRGLLLIKEILGDNPNLEFNLINAIFINPLDFKLLDIIGKSNKKILIYEENYSALSSLVCEYLLNKGYTNKVLSMNLKEPPLFGDLNDLLEKSSMDKKTILANLLSLCD